jgi:hypothetical protein
VFTDELTSSGADNLSADRAESDAAAKEPGMRYGEAARRDRQPRLTDLVPSRYLTLSLLLGANLLFVGLLLAAYHWQTQVVDLFGAEAAAVLDLAERESLSTWFSSLLLFSTAGVALLIYSLRRHRVDDYHGRYRVWLWAMLACLALSINETTAIHRATYAIVARLAAWAGISPITLGRGLLATVFCGFVVRLLVEIWRCRAASTALTLAAGLLLGSVTIHLQWIAIDDARLRVMLASGVQMLGHVGLLAALMLYARYVILDVEGRLPVRIKKVKARKPTAAKKPAKAAAGESDKPTVDPPQKINRPHTPVKTDLDPVAPAVARNLFSGKQQSAAATKPAASAAINRNDDDDDTDDSPADRGMSRAERKKMRRQMRRQESDNDD